MDNVSQQNYHVHISSRHNWLDLNLKEVWRYRDLIMLFTKRSFTVAYKQTILGPAWIFITPLFSSIVQAFVFGEIAGIGTNGVPTLLFYLVSNAVWNFFSTCLTGNCQLFLENAHIFGKVYFPRLTTPISNVISNVIRFFIQMLMALLFMAYFLAIGAVQPNWILWLLVPVELVHLGIMGLGFGIIISSMTTKYRDLSVLVGFGMSLWMYATPIVYPLSTLAEGWMKTIIQINPVTTSVELLRLAFLGDGMVNWGYYTLSWVITVLVAFFGIIVFNKVERTFMDTV